MNKLFRKRLIFSIVGVFVFALTLVWVFLSPPTVNEKIINIETNNCYDTSTIIDKYNDLNYIDMLTSSENTNKELNNNDVLFGWMVTFTILGGIFIFCLIVYIIVFFVFNKWVIFDNQPTRVIVLGKKNNKTKMITMSLLSIYRPNTEIFNKKEDALAFIKKQIN